MLNDTSRITGITGSNGRRQRNAGAQQLFARPGLDVDKLWATWQGLYCGTGRFEPARGTPERGQPALDGRMRALLTRVAAGDQGAYEELYGLLSHSVNAFVRRMVGNQQTADEVVVDTMYEIWRAAGRFRGESLVSTWVLGIARNKALMALRGNPQSKCEDIDDFSDVLDAGVPDGFALLAHKETRTLVQSCLRRLSDKHRECIHLAYFEDLSVAEIAALLDVPEGTVKSRLSEARAQLAARVSAMIPRAAMHAGRPAELAN